MFGQYIYCVGFIFILGELKDLQKVVFFLNIFLQRELTHADTDRFYKRLMALAMG